ncbi:universal stress protein [Vibrio sp. SS-MA-C1-2]|uniref:universal stress protein n=1 Tax=Vibrio sp. SS-MA-C1-2 TaxID=2908646 RepID=UPI001F3DD0B0|nr:universal stress protein [Vibrio sp. SS-MA-C1-2]UJF17005.1 universal stress protein [Vibrio sp. SS-MA-C1-2]
MKYRHILVAIDLNDESNLLIDRAKYLAKELKADISLIHVDASHGKLYHDLYDLNDPEVEPPLNKEMLDHLQPFIDHCEQPVKHIFVGTGMLSDTFVNGIIASEVDLLICGHHHDLFSRFISYSKDIIDKSPIDILVIPIIN